VRVLISRPVAASQSLRVLSKLPETMVSPSGEKAASQTLSPCPVRVLISRPVAASQSLRVLSQLPETMVLPSGEKAAA
jgi:hypothetical protein